MKRTFNLGGSIWFYLCYDSNNILKYVEEHDYRCGGVVHPSNGQSLENLFVETVVNRASGDEYKEIVRIKAIDFLTNQLSEMNA
jgi:hypothetical protein